MAFPLADVTPLVVAGLDISLLEILQAALGFFVTFLAWWLRDTTSRFRTRLDIMDATLWQLKADAAQGRVEMADMRRSLMRCEDLLERLRSRLEESAPHHRDFPSRRDPDL